MENIRLLKQSYLKTEILDKNYNPDYFLKFLEDRCGNATNFDTLTLNEIKQIVSLYKARWIDRSQFENLWVIKSEEQIDFLHRNKKDFAQNKDLENELNEINKIFEGIEVGLLKKEINEKEKITTEGFLFQEKNKKEEYIECNKLDSNSLTDVNNLSFEISNPETVKEGFIFSSTYIQYLIKVMPINKVIIRKENYFTWLYQKLSQLYPEYILPSFETKAKEDSKKMMLYSMFLNALGQNKNIRSTKIFHSFVNLEQNDFKNVQYEINKKNPPKLIMDRSNLEGKINVAISTEVQVKNSMFDLDKKKNALKRLKQAILKVIDQFKQVGLSLEELSNSYIDVRNSYFNYPKLYQSFDQLSQIMQSWNQGIKTKEEFFQNDLFMSYQFMQKEIKKVEPFLSKYKTMKSDFDSLSKKYISPNLEPKDIYDKKFIDMKHIFGYTSNILCQEFDSLMERQYERITKQLEKIKRDNNKDLSNYSFILKLLSYKL